MNLYRRVINAVSNVVYKTILRRGKNDTPDAKLTAWLAQRGLTVSMRGTNVEMKDEILRTIKQ